jgi:hypothetical protein
VFGDDLGKNRKAALLADDFLNTSELLVAAVLGGKGDFETATLVERYNSVRPALSDQKLHRIFLGEKEAIPPWLGGQNSYQMGR